jgi:hypothetical protein
MGFFKSLGTKLKRAISIKNLTNVATGNFSAVGQDLIRVATTEKITDSNGKVTIVPNGFSKTPVVIPDAVSAVLDSQGAKFNQKVVSAVASNTTVQNATDLLTKIGIQAFWNKNKNWIIGLGASVVLFVVVKMSFFGKHRKGGKRT